MWGNTFSIDVIPLPNKSGLNITIAKYLTPLDNDINRKGITPHIEIPLSKSFKGDAEFIAAKNKLKEIIKK